MTDQLVGLVREGVRVYDLGRPMFVGMPQSPNHPRYFHTYPRRHGDHVRPDGGSAANDLLFTGTHVGTHIDALAHVSQDGKLHGGADARAAAADGQFAEHGVHTIQPMVRRGLLIDVAGFQGLNACPPAHEITPDELDATVQSQGVHVEPGDVLLIRTGWGGRFAEGTESYLGHQTGVPGVGEQGAYWLAEHRILAAGADTIAFERLGPGDGHAVLPAHRVLLVEAGIYIIEALALDELARARVYEFVFVLAPLNLVGATGSPVRPLAVVCDG
jgi:kynurenine formamidase